MQKIPLPTQAQVVFNQFEAAGGVLEYIAFDPDLADPTHHDTHRRAAILTVEAITRPSLSINYALAETMQGTQIDRLNFLGERWSLERKSLIVNAIPDDAGGNILFHAIDPPLLSSRIEQKYFPSANPDDEHFVGSGYAYAFSFTPYTMRLRPRQIQTLFDEINTALLPNLHDGPLQIYRWPTNWAAYFDAGHEWWGDFPLDHPPARTSPAWYNSVNY